MRQRQFAASIIDGGSELSGAHHQWLGKKVRVECPAFESKKGNDGLAERRCLPERLSPDRISLAFDASAVHELWSGVSRQQSNAAAGNFGKRDPVQDV